MAISQKFVVVSMHAILDVHFKAHSMSQVPHGLTFTPPYTMMALTRTPSKHSPLRKETRLTSRTAMQQRQRLCLLQSDPVQLPQKVRPSAQPHLLSRSYPLWNPLRLRTRLQQQA
jgi:hypothetical protein